MASLLRSRDHLPIRINKYNTYSRSQLIHACFLHLNVEQSAGANSNRWLAVLLSSEFVLVLYGFFVPHEIEHDALLLIDELRHVNQFKGLLVILSQFFEGSPLKGFVNSHSHLPVKCLTSQVYSFWLYLVRNIDQENFKKVIVDVIWLEDYFDFVGFLGADGSR